ncbi:MAG: cell surface protein SprA, partial [Candidatus Eisenbacteria sp.]|nr:cell surface protein SprA [Candidatus Eisenbacteria bacterium]
IKILDRANVGEDQEINVTYKRAGGFGQASKTLVGVAAFYQPEDSKFNMSSSWLYQSCGSPDRRPRLGSEPTRTTVGEMAASYRTESMGLTRMLDRLPMLEARRPSKITVDGGIGVSFPNPNTRNDLYIDDFEGVADDTYIRLNRLAWKPCGLPLAAPGESDSAKAARKAELWWYTPFRGTREGDLNPTLEYLEAKDHKQVLELQFWPYPSPEGLVGDFWDADSSWAGIVQGLSGSYLDLTRARFLDIWINDFKRWDPGAPYPADRRGTMYVELGRMSEDAIWARRPIDGTTGKVTGSPHVPPNGALDTEDTNYDGELDLSDSRDEDTGLDGVLGKEGGANDDGANDDYGYSADSEREYSEYPELWETYKQINGTEGNGKLDTEDLDADNSFKRVNSYFQFKVDLADTSVVETDVAHDYGNRDDVRDITEDNGWRRIRIPLSDAFVDACINDPDWTEIKHLRIWFTAMGDPPPGEAHRIQIGGIEIRSNRWMAEAIRDTSGTDVDPDALIAMEEDFFPGVVSNKENADIYDAPFEVHRDRDKDNVPEKEQSLTLEVRNFQPGHTGSIYMPFLREQSYMGYEFLELWLNSTIPEHQDADFYFRLCKDANVDTTHYYEYRVPVPKKAAGKRKGSWKRVKIRLTDMSDLKNKVDEYNAMHPSDSTRIDTASVRLDDGARLSIKGQPNLTKIKRITMGVQNPPDAEVIEDASIWVDELRLTEVHRDVDVAYRVQVRAELSDFGKFDLSYKRVGADFASISGGGTRQRKETETALSTNASLPIDRLLPRQLGLRMPFSYSYDRRKRVPKYRTNDDLLVGDAPTDRDVTESANRSMSLSLSRNKSRSGLLKYTLDAVKVSGSHKTSYSGSPLSQDSTRTASMSVNYNTSLGSLGDMRLYRNWKVRLTPTNVGASLNRSQTTRTRYRRENGDLTRPFFLDDDRTTQSGALSLTTGMRPIQAVTYNFRQNRNLMLKGTALYIGGLNLGTETSRQEDLNATHTLRLLRGWFEPRLNWKGTFKGTFNEQSSGTGGSLKRSHTLTNNRSGSISGEIPLSKLLGLLGQISSRSGKEKDEKEEGEKDDSREQEQPEGTEFRNDRPSDPKRSTSRRPARGGVASSGLSGAVAKIVRLTRTNGSFSAGEQSTYSRVLGKPTIAYQLGLSMDPGVVQLSNGRESRSKNQGYGIDMDFKFLKTVSVSTTFKRSKSQSMSSGTHTENIESRWPEMDVRWGDLAKRFRLKRFIQTAKASTRYSRKEKSSKQEGELRKRETNAQWGPLVDLNMGFSNGVSVVFRLDYSSYCTEDLSGWHRESNRTNTRLSLSAKKNFKITREVTMPLTGSKQRVTTRLDLGMSLKLDRNRNATQEEGHKEQVTADTNRLDFSVDGSYQFTRSITGRVAISCGENADNKNKTKTSRYVAVNLSAGFTF